MKRTIFALTMLAMASANCFSQTKEVCLVDRRDHCGAHNSCIPTVSYDNDDVTVSCDSVINNVDIVIRDQYGNVMHQSTQTITPMESTIFVPATGDGSEKCTIDLYYDRKHLSGTFEE